MRRLWEHSPKEFFFQINEGIPGGRTSTNKSMESWESLEYLGTLKKFYVFDSQRRVLSLLPVKGMAIITGESLEVYLL